MKDVALEGMTLVLKDSGTSGGETKRIYMKDYTLQWYTLSHSIQCIHPPKHPFICATSPVLRTASYLYGSVEIAKVGNDETDPGPQGAKLY